MKTSEANIEDLKGMVVSDGTMRSEDLIPKFLNVLKVYGRDVYDKYVGENPEVLDLSGMDDETMGWVVDELFDKLNEIAPEGYSFGSQDGDGACYGFWSVDADERKKCEDVPEIKVGDFVEYDKNGKEDWNWAEVTGVNDDGTLNLHITDMDKTDYDDVDNVPVASCHKLPRFAGMTDTGHYYMDGPINLYKGGWEICVTKKDLDPSKYEFIGTIDSYEDMVQVDAYYDDNYVYDEDDESEVREYFGIDFPEGAVTFADFKEDVVGESCVKGMVSEGWSGGFFSREDVLNAMDGGILNKDWKLEKRFGNWGCYVNQKTGRPLVMQVMVSQDRTGDWGYKPVTSDMGPVDTNIQAAKWLKPRLEQWASEDTKNAESIPEYEWHWIDKCLGKETANKDRKNLVKSLVKGDKIKLIDTVANGAVVTFIDMITPSKMRIDYNGREMSCKTSFIDHKVEGAAESKKCEAYIQPVTLYSTTRYDDAEAVQSFLRDIGGDAVTVDKQRNGDVLSVNVSGSDDDVEAFVDTYKNEYGSIVKDCEVDATGWTAPEDIYYIATEQGRKELRGESKKGESAGETMRVDVYADRRNFDPEEFVKYVRKAGGKNGGYISVDSVVSVDVLNKANRLAQANDYKRTESKKSEADGGKDIFTLDLTRIYADGNEEGLDDMQAAQNFYDEDEAIQAAKDLADSYKDDDDVVQVTVMAGEQEKPNGDIVGDSFDIFTASSSDSVTTAKYREKANYTKTDGLDYYAKGGKSESKKSEDFDMNKAFFQAKKAITDWTKRQGHKTLEWLYTDGRKSPTSYPSGIWDFEWDTGNGMATAELKVSPYETRTNSWNDRMDFSLRVGTEDKPVVYTSVEDVLSALDTLISKTEIKMESKKSETKEDKPVWGVTVEYTPVNGETRRTDVAPSCYTEERAKEAAIARVTKDYGPLKDVKVIRVDRLPGWAARNIRDLVRNNKTESMDNRIENTTITEQEFSDILNAYVKEVEGNDIKPIRIEVLKTEPVEGDGTLIKLHYDARENGWSNARTYALVFGDLHKNRDNDLIYVLHDWQSGEKVTPEDIADHDWELVNNHIRPSEILDATKSSESLDPALDVKGRGVVELIEDDYLKLSRDINSRGYCKDKDGAYNVWIGGSFKGTFPSVEAAADAGYTLVEGKRCEAQVSEKTVKQGVDEFIGAAPEGGWSDYWAMQQDWEFYKDSLCRDGVITQKQADSWSNPCTPDTFDRWQKRNGLVRRGYESKKSESKKNEDTLYMGCHGFFTKDGKTYVIEDESPEWDGEIVGKWSKSDWERLDTDKVIREWRKDHPTKSFGESKKSEARPTKQDAQIKELCKLCRNDKNVADSVFKALTKDYNTSLDPVLAGQYLTAKWKSKLEELGGCDGWYDGFKKLYAAMGSDFVCSVLQDLKLGSSGIGCGACITIISDIYDKVVKRNESKKSESLTLKQKELKDMARYGEAEDITTISDVEAKELKKKGIETVGISRGAYGMNGALLRDSEGKKYVITARSSNLFYFV